jgi:ABC-type nitrate/sulfonate/bicarbonate transport system ATPase subunit
LADGSLVPFVVILMVMLRVRASARCAEARMIQLIDVHKSFGAKRVLSGFTLDVVEGETMVIIGYSGPASPSRSSHIVGLLEPDRGNRDRGWARGAQPQAT